MTPREHFLPWFEAWYAGMVAGDHYGVISNNGKTITIVTFGSVDAIGVDEVSSGPLLMLWTTPPPPPLEWPSR
jgi:hypothetical protein